MTGERQTTIDQVEGAMPDAGEVEAVESERSRRLAVQHCALCLTEWPAGPLPCPDCGGQGEAGSLRRLAPDQPAPQPTGAIHPVADLFPMMTDEELDELAADIIANGQREPILLNSAGVLIDGRNRLAACRRAEAEPWFELIDVQNPVAFIISANVKRRHLSKGQQAMLMVAANSLVTNEFGAKQRLADEVGLKRERVVLASVVYQWAPDLVPDVIAGILSLDEAHKTARENKEAFQSRPAQMTRLEAAAPDLAELVKEERLTLAEGMAIRRKREADEERAIRCVTENLDKLLLLLDPGQVSPAEAAETFLQADPATVGRACDFSAVRGRRCLDVLERWVRAKEGQESEEGNPRGEAR